VARRFVDSALSEPALAPVAYTAVLLASELVANAVLHGGAPLEVTVTVEGHRARVEVFDGSPRLPVRRNYSTMSGTGRGLVLVERLATRWGIDPTPTGKVVWFELDAAQASLVEIEVDAL